MMPTDRRVFVYCSFSACHTSFSFQLEMASTIKILFVEDVSSFAFAITADLKRRASFRPDIVLAETLGAALEKLTEQDFDLVLLDLSLPDSRGLETLSSVRAVADQTPVIVLTGADGEEIALEALKLGAQDYLIKGDLDGKSLGRSIVYSLERARIENERSRLYDQRENVMAVLTHDLKNPLIGADRIYDLLLTGAVGELSADLDRIVQVLKKTNDDLLHMIQNLLRLYRIDRGLDIFHFEGVDLESVADNCVSDLSSLARIQNVQISTEFTRPLPQVNADRQAVKHVIGNLLHNAIKYSSAGGNIELNAGHANGSVRLKIRDYGRGIPQTEQKMLFKRATQGENGKLFKTGTGLGLFLCQQIVSAHNGTLECVSELNEGTTFTLDLPTAVEAAVPS
jgi:two-component system, sensor histidine kinase and response regulator